MSERNIGLEILDGGKEIKDFKAGKVELKTRRLSTPSDPKSIRHKLGFSQAAFAGLMGVSLRTIQNWEQGRRTPSGPAKSLLRIAEQHPKVFLEVVYYQLKLIINAKLNQSCFRKYVAPILRWLNCHNCLQIYPTTRLILDHSHIR